MALPDCMQGPSEPCDGFAEIYHELERLRAENAELRALLKDCADDLEASVNAEYRDTLDYPSQKRKWERDMEPVVKVRAALARREG